MELKLDKVLELVFNDFQGLGWQNQQFFQKNSKFNRLFLILLWVYNDHHQKIMPYNVAKKMI